jgi:hypothetical protein
VNRPWREACLGVLSLTAAAVVLTLPLSGHLTRTLPSDGVDTVLNAWILGWDADRLRHGLHGLWNAPAFFPYQDTLAFSENLLGIAVFVAPVYWATSNPVFTYNIAFLGSFVLAGVGMYVLVRSLTNDRRAAAAAAMYYAFCPFRMTQVSHIQMIATGWMPLAIWGLHRYFATAKRRWLAVFAGGWILQALSNSYMFFYLCVPAAAVTVDGIWRSRRRTRDSVEILLSGVAIVVALAPVGAAYYRVRTNYHQVRNLDDMVNRSPDLRSYVEGKTSIGDGRWLPTSVVSDPEKELFPGMFSLALAAIAIGGWRSTDSARRRLIVLYGAVAVASVVLSLGPYIRVWGYVVTEHGPYRWLLAVVPGMSGMRVPGRFAIVFEAALAVLVGLGVARLCAATTPRFRPVVIAVCLVAVVADGYAVPITIVRYAGGGRPEDRAVAEWLRDKPAGGVLHLPALTNSYQELHYQYVTLFHRHPVVNSYSGYDTPLFTFFRDGRSPLIDFDRFPATIRMLRALGIRYVVLHSEDYNMPTQWEIEPTINGMRASEHLVREARVLNTLIFELEPWSAPSSRAPGGPINPREFVASASDAQERLAFAFDGDPDTRWIGAEGNQSGAPTWLAARFAAPCDVSRVELQMAERSLTDVPADLEIVSTDAQGRSRTLYHQMPYAELVLGLLRDADYPVLVIDLPPNETTTLTLRAMTIPRRPWSVHELRLWRR